ncbi:MAG TPA: ATP-binding protein [Steroidobacteraceae bacterium]|nr:ATP-binding protein [Steroidobacteraceae bacterium]
MTEPTKSNQTPEQTTLLLGRLLEIARISALEEMASGIAHELNQPIGAITTFAQAAQRMLNRPEPMIAQTSDVLGHISHEALNAGQGIRRIRSLFNGQPHGLVECQIADVVGELMPIFDLLGRPRSATLALSVEPDLPKVSIDRLRIQHVLFALIQNALEAPTSQGLSPHIGIAVTGDRYGVQVAVTDRGTGVPEQAREQLFHPFFTTKTHGTGLGLASSRAIAEAHQGSIGFENVAGGGARFWLRLPAATADGEIAR